MVDGIGSRAGGAGGGGLAGVDRLKAELQRMRERSDELRGVEQQPTGATSFASVVKEELGAVDKSVQEAGSLHLDAIRGELDFHEVASKIKQAELSFGFAMQVRNKLIDAYREVMRMSV